MSVMFRKAVEAHIEQLKDRIHSANPHSIEEEMASVEGLLQKTTDSRLRNALSKRIATLQNAKRSAGGGDDYKKLLSAVQTVYAQIKERPEYNVVRKRRTPKVKPNR